MHYVVMLLIENYVYLNYFIWLNFFFFIIFILGFFMFYFVGFSGFIALNMFNMYIYINLFFLVYFFLSFLFIFCSFLLYCFFIYNYTACCVFNGNFMPSVYYVWCVYIYCFDFKYCVYSNLVFDLFGYIFIIVAYIVGFLSIIILSGNLYLKNVNYYYILYLFFIIVFFFSINTNIFFFFFLYECLLIPSFLFVYNISPGSSAIQASIYFLIWTQFGSFVVLVVISYIISISGCYDFLILNNFNFRDIELLFCFFFLFVGFGVKVPIWPFHYWLINTHVEASSGFSVYLSGFLVNSAVFGFFRFVINIDFCFNTLLYVIICLLGVVDSSFNIFNQIDINKVVAYCTIQEMNIIFLGLCLNESILIFCSIMYVFVHAILSSIMFFLVDCIYRSFHTSNVTLLCGVWVFCPVLSFCILIMCILYSGLPGTIKFLIEFLLISIIVDFSVFFCVVFVFVNNFICLVGFFSIWYGVVFCLNSYSFCISDLAASEIRICIISFLFLIFSAFIFGCFF